MNSSYLHALDSYDTSNSKWIGGVVANTGFCKSCCNLADLNIESATNTLYVGGITGVLGQSLNCANYGNIMVTSYTDRGGPYVGGINGEGEMESLNNYNIGNINILTSHSSARVGGVAGCNKGVVSNSYNFGKITCNRGIVGGIIGQSYSDENSKAECCYYLRTDTINNELNAIGNENVGLTKTSLGYFNSVSSTSFTFTNGTSETYQGDLVTKLNAYVTANPTLGLKSWKMGPKGYPEFN